MMFKGSLSSPGTSGSGRDNEKGLDGEEGRGEDGASIPESMRPPTPVPRERGLIEQMEETREAGFGGQFNGEV